MFAPTNQSGEVKIGLVKISKTINLRQFPTTSIKQPLLVCLTA